ncbi:hypothetical protein [Streptomyces sp. NPDC058665]|uniref:hypothetical protein n=1 Tax=Streptomyces sp. NPDC058665 TaxID=3346586 RepID=UPI003661E8EF
MSLPELTYRADCVAYTLHDRRLFWLGGHAADSPWTALTWLAERAEHIADQLDSYAARPLRAWRADGREQQRALARLGREVAYSFLVRDELVIYILSAAPVPAHAARRESVTAAGPRGGLVGEVSLVERQALSEPHQRA